ncbi:U11/U12 small nuclear ribonucleoprotein 25 kDa protein [Lingula anatina]|uniref:U11/U12 small nuclear ribonucleoprotein 25 kDa protein n=1 Tax=Lingula anatina TaxID=7574 RepID=A0A1S3K650_LINAN|nr:U11/U12 small nuclear ribonucleoprotein 25 kDa protein [Lingula anatina]|eukprot:XP_013417987.1 U11/U12 small nuclear ribonucleoprotein 25 kDa protein [Lingula anatina]
MESENAPHVKETANEEERHNAASEESVREDNETEKIDAGERRAEEEEEGESDELSHKDAMRTVREDLAILIQNDPLLSDLPPEITLEEVNSQIALEYGQALTVNVRREDGEVMPIVVVQGGTVRDLKEGVKRYVMLKQHRAEGTKCISWRYIWRTYWLYFNGQKLTEDKKPIKDYGIGNRDEVTFIKRLRQQ